MTAADPLAVQTEFAFELRATVEQPLVIGESSHGLRRMVPITGGSFEGPGIRGRVLPGGADWQFVRPDGVLSVEALYTLATDDGVLIMVTNRGLRHGPPEIIDQLTRGIPVPPGSYYFRTMPAFEAPIGSRYEWMNKCVFVAAAIRQPDFVVVRVYKIM